MFKVGDKVRINATGEAGVVKAIRRFSNGMNLYEVKKILFNHHELTHLPKRQGGGRGKPVRSVPPSPRSD
ncbi:MAG: hypothetical protein SAJ72_09285 [Jaaginema sp. PMC 1080.18]|nr:hypothetical protein [Jaaginema sp. PMC 1080.18]